MPMKQRLLILGTFLFGFSTIAMPSVPSAESARPLDYRVVSGPEAVVPLLWNQENAVNRGIQLNYTQDPLTFAFSWNDGFYSNRYTLALGFCGICS